MAQASSSSKENVVDANASPVAAVLMQWDKGCDEGRELVMARVDSVVMIETSVCGRASRFTQFTLVDPSGPRVNRGVRRGARTDKDDVKPEDLLLNISRETENLAVCYLEQFARFVGKKNDYEKFFEQFGRRLKLGNHEDSTYRTVNTEW